MVSPENQRAPRFVERAGPAVFRISVGMLWLYLCTALLLERTIGGIAIRFAVVAGVAGAGVAAIFVTSRLRFHGARLFDVGVFSFLLVVGCLSADALLTIRDNWLRSRIGDRSASARRRDSQILHGELFPRAYVPHGQTFAIYKPNVRIAGETVGYTYFPEMLTSPTLASTLERRWVSYHIGPEGFRETEPIEHSRTFALGDSFTFGDTTDEGKVWTDILSTTLHEPVYNLGVSATGPRAQFDRFRWVLDKHQGSLHVDHLLWMIYEGNDLEEPYSSYPADESDSGPAARLLSRTWIEPLIALPFTVKSGSAMRKLLDGELTVSLAAPRYGRYDIDGVALPMPLLYSPRFGNHLFDPITAERAAQPIEYVLNHPNRPKLDSVFREMRDLSDKRGFAVTVIIAPSHPRLYGSQFPEFPILPEPHVIEYVEKLGNRMRFEVINLLPLLRPFAEKELLYYRDDVHWNVRGNQVVAALIANQLEKGKWRTSP